MKRLLLSLVLVGLIALPAMAQTPVSTQYLGPTITNHGTKDLDPPVFLENTYRNNGGWLNWWPYAGLPIRDDVGTVFSQGTKENLNGNNMSFSLPTFTMTGFDVGWYSIDTNTTHIQTLTVNFYDNPDGADYGGYSVGTVWVSVPPTLLQSYTVTAFNAPGANFTAFDITDDSLYEGVGDTTGVDVLLQPTDLWMEAMVGIANTGIMMAKDWGTPNPWWTGGPPGSGPGSEYGHSDFWWAGWGNWSQYWSGPPTPTSGAPYYDAYNPSGSFTFSIYGIPEPATLGLLALSGLAMIRRRR